MRGSSILSLLPLAAVIASMTQCDSGTPRALPESNSSADASPDAIEGPASPHRITGVVQKGPFVRGTKIQVQELDKTLEPTGRITTVDTQDDLGHFDLANVSSTHVEIVASGYYFDELSGQISPTELTLSAIADVSAGTHVNVNLLTTLAARRERRLVAEGKSFAEARVQAESEVLSALRFSNASASFAELDVSKAGDDNALLLSASILLAKLGYERNSASPVAELSQLLTRISSDIEADGVYDDANTAGLLRCVMPTKIDAALVRENLSGRYAALDAGVSLPAFEPFLAIPASCCTPLSRRCSGDTLQTCDEARRWQDAACDGICRNGECEPRCTPGNTACEGTAKRVCDSAGRWQNGGSCAWSAPVALDTGPFYSLEIGGDSGGGVTAMWESSSLSFPPSLRASRYEVGAGWTQTTTISATGHNPRLSVAPSGLTAAMWNESESLPDGSWKASIVSSQYTPGSGWDANNRILESNGGFFDTTVGQEVDHFYDIAITGNTAHAVWFRRSDARVWWAQLAPASGWTAPSALNVQAPSSAEPKIRTNAAGDAIAVWSSRRVVANQYVAGKGWEGPTLISDTLGTVNAVAINDGGNAVAASWSDLGSNSATLSANYYQRGAGWGLPSLLADSVPIFGTRRSSLDVAIGRGGEAIAVWTQADGVARISIWANVYRIGQGWTGATLIKSIDIWETDVQVLRVLMDEHGNARVVWYELIGGKPLEVWSNRYSDASGWGSAESWQFPTCVTVDLPPALVVDPFGRITLLMVGSPVPNDCSPPMRRLVAMRFE